MQENKKSVGGVIIMLISAVCFSTSGVFFKFITWNPISINGARNLVGAIVLALFMLITKHKIKMNRSVISGAVCVFLTSLLFSYANKMTSSANAIVLQFTMPIFVILFMAAFYHKKPIPSDIFACAGILGGIICFFIDGFSSGGMTGNILALCSGCTYAGVFMMNMGKNSDSLSSSLWGQLLAAIVGVPFIFTETDFSATVITAVVAMGIIEIGLAYLLLSIGILKTTPLAASLISAIEPILNPILVAIFFHEMLSAAAFIGTGLVVITLIIYNVNQVFAARSAKKISNLQD